MKTLENIKIHDIVLFEPERTPQNSTIAVVTGYTASEGFYKFRTLIDNTGASVPLDDSWSYNVVDRTGFKLTNLGTRDECPEYFL